ncbi:MAG TPA: DUF11 domain-containing protein, partial [Acidimicrobiales bacterium]|nr:DUF11 domain-containing protein [Acidimicrobiales bacterium]
GTYTLTESASADPRFATGTITCGAVSGPASAGLTVTLASGEDLACAATNTRLPTDISVLKTATALEVGPGTDVTYTIQVKVESATVPADNVLLKDTMPAGLTLRSVTSAQMMCTTDGNSFNCTKAVMAPAETATVSVVATVGETAAPGSIDNVASVESSTTETTLSNNSDDASITVLAVEVTPLPRTGAYVRDQLWLSALLLVIGGGILFLARRRTA